MFGFTACSTISDKVKKVTPSVGKECPAQGERTIKDIFCKEIK
tara:strand:+ start:231 stop:359 length:129 start_codon:yes stop_codon:yes gene_type:complete